MLNTLKVYSLSDLHKILAEKTDVKISDVEKLVVQFGTYREINNKLKVLLEEDIREFFNCIAARRAKRLPPPDDEAGLIVFIGSSVDESCPVLVEWSPVGQELALLDRVKEYAVERVMVLATANATPRDVREFKAAHKKSWRYGNWFGRTERFMSSVRKLTGDGDGEGEEEVEAIPEVVGAKS